MKRRGKRHHRPRLSRADVLGILRVTSFVFLPGVMFLAHLFAPDFPALAVRALLSLLDLGGL